MLAANFFLNLFKYKKDSSFEIVQYDKNRSFTLQDQINNEIKYVDQKISINSKALVEAQLVKLRSSFTKSNNLLENIGKNIYKKKVEESINWHQKDLKNLYVRRRELVTELEKIQGIFWLNQIKRIFVIILIIFLILILLIVFFTSFILLIYSMPFILLILIGYFIYKKRY
tara:strand:- start:199 stop:711 length:513 start_codon:yes stop_codon:yes gene_type:complete